MSTFDDLRKLFIEWDNRYKENNSNSWRFIYGLAGGFSKFIGAPNSYKEIGSNEMQHYVQPLQAVKDEEGNITYESPQYTSDVITRGDDGYWLSGIRLVMDRSERSFPKSDFTFAVQFILRDQECELMLGDRAEGHFKFNLDDPTPDSVYEYMVSLLQEVFTSKPDTFKKPMIGFVVPSFPPENEPLIV
jgi:hypothetical protein